MVDASNHNFLEFANNGTFIGWGANRRVGIYDTTANAMDVVGKLNVTSAMGVSRGVIDFNFTQSGLTIWNTDNTPLSLGTSGVNRMQISATGIITLGTQAPQSTAIAGMRVNGNNFEWGHTNTGGYHATLGAEAGTGAPFIALNAEAGTTSNTYRTRGRAATIIRASNGTFSISALASSNADNQSLVDRLTIAANGAATFAGAINGTIITASGAMYSSNWFRSYGTTGWYNETYGGGVWMEDTTWVKVYASKSFYVSNTIACTGNITAYYSDDRFKTRVDSLDNALDKVCGLTGFVYTENELARSLGYTSDKRQIGLSAQEVQKVLPEAVSLAPVDMETSEFTGEITSKSGEDYLTVDYARLVPLLVEAIKELRAELNELKGIT
jgi:hypothetical protein